METKVSGKIEVLVGDEWREELSCTSVYDIPRSAQARLLMTKMIAWLRVTSLLCQDNKEHPFCPIRVTIAFDDMSDYSQANTLDDLHTMIKAYRLILTSHYGVTRKE